MADGTRVNTEDLKLLASDMAAQQWPAPRADAAPPDALQLTKDVVASLNENAAVLQEYQKIARAESERLGQMLTFAANAYEAVDTKYKDKMDDPGRHTEVEAITLPAPSTPMPPIPDGPSIRGLDAGGYGDVEQTQGLLASGDHGASLNAAAVEWGLAADKLVTNTVKHRKPSGWEGEAANAAFSRINAYSDWLHELSDAWLRLGHEAEKVHRSHSTAFSEHTEIYAKYIQLKAQLLQMMANPGSNGPAMGRVQRGLEELQRQSDEVREVYAKNATVSPVRPSDPRFASSGTPMTGAGGGGNGSGGPGQPAEDPTALAQRMGQSMGQPQSGSPAGAGAPLGGGAPCGGGSPSGGGAPSGGMPAGLPGGGPSTGTPKLPTDPSLRPAAGGGGAGAGGGGAGGGVPTMPLSPAVSAETVAPTAPAQAGPSAPAGASTGAAAGSGMGGMAPMHGAGHQNQGKDKRRDPNLSPDEDLYTEDRAWTEAVIGNRRRRDVQDGKEFK
jgi:hypothetical protein